MKLISRRIMVSLLLLVLAAQQGCGFLVSSGSNAGSVTKDIQVGTNTEYNSLTVLDKSFLGDDWSLSGSDKNSLRNIVNSGSNAQEVIIENSGSVNLQGSTATDSSTMGSTLSGQTTGETDLIVSSESNNNQMFVAATGEEIGTDLNLATGQSASIIGSVSVNQELCLDEETSSYVSSGANGFSANGLRMTSDGNLKDFGLVAVNHEKGVVKNGDAIIPGVYGNYDYEGSWVPLLSYDPYNKYALDGAIWLKSNVQLTFNPSGMPSTLVREQSKSAILSAANTWDTASTKELFADQINTDSKATAGRLDGKNTHQWKRLSDRNALAMATTWFNTGSTLKGANGVSYYTITESDVGYNTAFSWSNNPSDTNLFRESYNPATGTWTSSGSKILVESAALHELGHTMGLGDTYLNSTLKYDLSQIMTYYTDPQVTLGSGDRAGITALYG